MNKKLSFSVRIDSFTSAHVYISIFMNMVYVEYTHSQVTRGKAGDLVLRKDELVPWLNHVKPHILTCMDTVNKDDLWKLTGHFDLIEPMDLFADD